jgi:hypothetical protein
MAVEPQEYEDDPIIEALGISESVRPVIPPIDVVYGYYQRTPPTFRLYLETFGMYMECPLGRLLLKSKASRSRSQLYLNAQGNYQDDITIGFTSLAAQEDTQETASTHMALYARYEYAKTTPWHE